MNTVTQWFHPNDKPKRSGWYDVQRGASRLQWQGKWNGKRFTSFKCLTSCTFTVWINNVLTFPDVTAWRGLAAAPADKGERG